MSVDGARFGWTLDAPGNLFTQFYLLSDTGYGFIGSASTEETFGDVDNFRITLDPGSSYTITLTGSNDYFNDATLDAEFLLLDEQGNVVAESVDVGDVSQITFTADASVYYVSVYSFDTGEYSVSWQNNSVSDDNLTGQGISLNNAYLARLDYASDVDKYSFSATAGERLYFEIISDVADLYFDVETSGGEFFANLVSLGNGVYAFDTDVSGSYILSFWSTSFLQTGDFEFYFTDFLRSFTDIVLEEGLDKKARLLGSDNVSITGNSNDNSLVGNSGDNVLDGLDGRDVLNGAGGSDVLLGGAGNDTYVTDGLDTITEIAGQGTDTVQTSVSFTLGANLENLVLTGSAAINGTGNTLANRLTGNSASNVLNGAGGADVMLGGAGNDTYITNGSDTITENAGQGTDTVHSSVSYALGANLENLLLTGTLAINGTGNTLANRLTGNSANNVLNGAGGTDAMLGGAGNDTYVTNGGDTITENVNQGTDTVQSSVSLTLGANLENLLLTGTLAINGTGNALANRLTGNSANNVLNGAGGADEMLGGAGNDTYVTNGGDTITETYNQGTDTVQSSVTLTLGANLEKLTLTGSANINGTGNTLVNTILGNAGANFLNGGAGSDTVTGGSGADTFVFNTALGATNVDRITDFNVAADTIRLENAIFTELAGGTLTAAAFVKNTSGNAVDASDRIIYESDTGKLYFDSDGTGGAAKVHFATIGTNLAVTNADFFVF